MKRLFAFLCSVFLLSGLFTSCGSEKEIIKYELDQNWEYCLEEPTEDTVFTPMETSNIRKLEDLVEGRNGYIWIKNNFNLPENFLEDNNIQNGDLYIYLGRIAITDVTTINGTLIGTKGINPPKLFSAWNVFRAYYVPSSILTQESPNSLLIKIYVEGEGSIDTIPYFSNKETILKVADSQNFWNSKLFFLFAFFQVMIALYHFFLFKGRRKDKEFLYFGIINILSALYMTVFCLNDIPGAEKMGLSFLWHQKICSNAIPFIIAFLIATFINAYVKRKERLVNLIGRIIFLAIPLTMIIFAPNYMALKKMNTFIMPFLFPPMLYILWIAISSVVKKRLDAWWILIGFSPLPIFVILDVLIHSVFQINNFPYITSMGWMMAILVFLIILAGRFTNALTSSEELNKNLELKVAERTEELSASNTQLTEANEKLERAKAIADKDMKLAVYVQQSFYRHFMPHLSDWEVASYFKPMSGVSGDMYTFFENGKQLKGAGLFDVSGHGIASGLVTMLAKTVVDRKFQENENLPLGKVMQEINESIIKEKGEIENYMTGVLLRFTDKKIEYVNCGHPKSFCRVAGSANVLPIELKGEENGAGGIIGIDGLMNEFKAIKFSLNKGDAIILYTDCLSESRNAEGEEFTQEKVAEVFGKSGNGNAQEKLDYVLKEFEKFTEGVPLNDDLTMIVIQKK